MVTFTVYRGDQIVQELDLQGPEITIGRNSANQVVLPDEGKGVSRDHATLRYEGGRYLLYDRNSKIGTLVDGKKIKRVALEPGQEFVIGPYRLVFNVADESSSGLRPTVVLPPPTPPPAPDVPAREGTEKRLASGSTQSTHPAGRSQTLGARTTGAMAWLTRQPPSLLYGAAAVVLVLFGAILIWQLWPAAPPQGPPITQATTTTTSTTTTSIPDAPFVDPHEGAITQAETAIAAAEELLIKGQFQAASRAFNRAVQDHLLPVLNANSSHAAALALQQRANVGAEEARNQLALIKANTPTVDYGPNPIERLTTESEEAYVRENQRANREWEDAERASRRGDYRGAHTLLVSLKKSLATRQAIWRDLDTRIASARKAWDGAQQQAIEEARMHERIGYEAAKAGQHDTAVTEYLAAKKGFEAAAALDTPVAAKELEENRARRRYLAGELVSTAQSYANRRRSEANKICQQIAQLLTTDERAGIDPEGVCKAF